MKNKLKHYLLSVPFSGGYAHAYLITTNESDTLKVMSRMEEEGTKLGLQPSRLPIYLQTHLEDGGQEVRDLVGPEYPEAKAMWQNAKKFHVTIFFTSNDAPLNTQLMELH